MRACASVLAVLAVVLPGGAAASAGVPGDAFFVSVCRFSHRAGDDPIVWPGRPRYSHDHTFVGNVSTNAFSTPASLRRGATTCTPRGDTAAYWAPTLLADGRPVVPAVAYVYYRRLTTARVRAFPPGLRMIAGDSHAWRPQSRAVTYWDCEVVKTTFYGPNDAAAPSPTASSRIPRCPPTARLELHVNFPECWDGKHLDSPDHQSQMAYASGGRCPAGHPVALPAISLVYQYRAAPVDGAHVLILSSGGQYSGHADFINAWNEPTLRRLVARCLDGYAYCAPDPAAS